MVRGTLWPADCVLGGGWVGGGRPAYSPPLPAQDDNRLEPGDHAVVMGLEGARPVPVVQRGGQHARHIGAWQVELLCVGVGGWVGVRSCRAGAGAAASKNAHPPRNHARRLQSAARPVGHAPTWQATRSAGVQVNAR